MIQWEEQHKAIDVLMNWLPTTFSRISRRDGDADMATAGALARCNRLLVGLDAIVHAGDLEDLAGVFVRPLYETWLTGLYVHFEGHAGWETLKGGARRTMNLINRESGLGVEAAAGWVDEVQAPGVSAIAHLVRDRLMEEGDPAAAFPVAAYSLVYRNASLRDAHGGAGSFAGHLHKEGGSTRLIDVRNEGISSSTHLLWCAVLLTVLAQRVFERFQLPTYAMKLGEITNPLGEARQPDHWRFATASTDASEDV